LALYTVYVAMNGHCDSSRMLIRNNLIIFQRRLIFGSWSIITAILWNLHHSIRTHPNLSPAVLYYEISTGTKATLIKILGDWSCVEAGSNTSTVALRVVGGDEKGTQCLGVYKYGDLALRVGGVSNLRK
jgi:hypothetical protein